MNLVLVEGEEVAADGTCTVRGRRAEHLRSVLGVEVGSEIRAGIVRGGVGSARVVAMTDDAITLSLALADTPMPPMPVDLILAVPRPKALSRVIEAAASFGVRRIDLTNSWRVDKSYLSSPRLAAAELADHARLGAEQGATTWLPDLAVHRRLMELLALPRAARTCVIAHPGAPPIESIADARDVCLAIGPEGGWIPLEVDTFIARGFRPISLGSAILRVETAVASALGQLALLQRRGCT